jgi:hypothetical protein
MSKSSRWMAVAILGGLLASASVFAADHADGPALATDKAADINDLYVFKAPGDDSKVVAVLTVYPFAGQDASFSDAVIYSVNFIHNETREVTPVVCVFPTEGAFGCSVGEAAVAGTVGGDAAEEGGVKAWAGLKDDPFFFDLAGFHAVVGGMGGFTGTDALSTQNTLAIIIELDKSLIGADGVYAVYGATYRMAHDMGGM